MVRVGGSVREKAGWWNLELRMSVCRGGAGGLLESKFKGK